MARTVRNYVGGEWVESQSSRTQDVTNPATGEVLACVPLSTAEEAGAAVAAAHAAFDEWQHTPALDRARRLFGLKELLERDFEDIARICTQEHGKTLAEARGDVRRGIENVEVACGIPSMMMGESLEDVARGIDCRAVRRPLGVFAAVTPFNFPPMVPLWFLPYAVACGNAFVLKPSEVVPLTQEHMFGLWEEAGFPAGVVNLVNGDAEVVDALCTHPDVKGISFVGSTPVARHVYETGTAAGKRVQALGGAKNFLVMLPDAHPEHAVRAAVESCFGCAGQRCLAGSVIVLVGDAFDRLRDSFVAMAEQIQVGEGTRDGVTMGPVISKAAQGRIEAAIERGVDEGAELLVDGRGCAPAGCEEGTFVGPTVFDGVTPGMSLATDEIFGPVMGLMHVDSVADAVEIVNGHEYGNTTSIFTESGEAARSFARSVEPSMIGINLGVPAPMSFFTFGGARGSFFGDLKAHGRDSIHFYTDRKTVISRWFGGGDTIDSAAETGEKKEGTA